MPAQAGGHEVDEPFDGPHQRWIQIDVQSLDDRCRARIPVAPVSSGWIARTLAGPSTGPERMPAHGSRLVTTADRRSP